MSSCYKCDGKGTHVNEAIDEGGFQSQGPEDTEAYFSGVYDVKCSACDGSGEAKEGTCRHCGEEAEFYEHRYQEYPGAGYQTEIKCSECGVSNE